MSAEYVIVDAAPVPMMGLLLVRVRCVGDSLTHLAMVSRGAGRNDVVVRHHDDGVRKFVADNLREVLEAATRQMAARHG